MEGPRLFQLADQGQTCVILACILHELGLESRNFFVVVMVVMGGSKALAGLNGGAYQLAAALRHPILRTALKWSTFTVNRLTTRGNGCSEVNELCFGLAGCANCSPVAVRDRAMHYVSSFVHFAPF
jgi:hypothetical protein